MGNSRDVYLDNAATTQVDERVLEKVNDLCRVYYGNPSSLHTRGLEAEKFVKKAAENVAKAINGSEEEIFFTSGGTESNNIAIRGVLKANRRKGKHIITTKLEHSSVKNIYKMLEDDYDITYLEVSKEGYVNLEQLEQSIREDTVLVSIMYVNNEIGTVQDIETIGKIIKNRNPETYFHVDGVQAFGKYKINVKKERIDLLTVSGHKIHAMKGSGAIFVKKTVKISPIVYGGGQQKGLRSGTENTPGIVSLGEATDIAYSNLEENMNKIRIFKTKLAEAVMERIPNVKVNGPSIEEGAPHVLSLNFKDIRGEVLLHALANKGIYVSTGSACSARKANLLSTTLAAIGCNQDEIFGTIRFSFSKYNDINDIPYAVEELAKAVADIRRTMRGR